MNAGGAFLYFRSAMQLPVPPSSDPSSHRRRALTASMVTGVLLLLVLITDVLGI